MADDVDKSVVPCRPIGYLRGGYREKFGAPRQSGLVSAARARVELREPYNVAAALRGLDGFSHLWLIWQAHANPPGEGFKPTVRPPRLGGNERIGVFASRSPFRPNPIAMSAVRLLAIDAHSGVLEVGGADLIDGTPILDIKPYLPYADSIAGATGGFAENAPEGKLDVRFECALPRDIAVFEWIVQTLALDPRPAFHNDPERIYSMDIGDLAIRWQVRENAAVVLSLTGAA